MYQQLRRHNKATITEALLRYGYRLSEDQTRIVRGHYLEDTPLGLLAEPATIHNEDSVRSRLKSALVLLRLEADPMELAKACERVRWALAAESLPLVDRNDLETLLRALGEL